MHTASSPQTARFPRLLFFTGGSALRTLSRRLPEYTPHSIHIVTTFDSGGSTAELRRCFALPALGDLRNRMLALADTRLVSAKVLEFLSLRLPMDVTNDCLRRKLNELADPDCACLKDAPREDAQLLCQALRFLLKQLPEHFDLRNASIGNFILASLYLQNKRAFGPTLALLGRFLHVQGTVLPVVDEALHLGCDLIDGQRFIGQHTFKSLPAAIERIFLTVHDPSHGDRVLPEEFCRPWISKLCVPWFDRADAIIYPMGSFYSSILVNLLVGGVGQKIASVHCPKIFIPNVGHDPELGSMDIVTQVQCIKATLERDCDFCGASVLTHVLVDPSGSYEGRLTKETSTRLADLGVTLLTVPLFGTDCTHHEPNLTIQAILGLLNHA